VSLNSCWDVTAERARRLRSVPSLVDVVLPRSALTRRALAEPVFWLVGPPKVGKTVLAHLIGHIATLGRTDLPLDQRIRMHEGAAACALELDRILNAPMSSPVAAVVLEDPLGTDVVDSPYDLADQIAKIQAVRDERSDVRLLMTSRHGPYLSARDELVKAGIGAASDWTIEGWYDPATLYTRYSSEVPELTSDLATRLGCPALIEQFRDHNVVADPASRERVRNAYGTANEITLDKLAVLERDDELVMLALLLRLQEYAFVLPTVNDLSDLLPRPYEQLAHAGLVATEFEFDDEIRLRFEHATTREAADQLLASELSGGRPLLGAIPDPPDWVDRAIDLWEAERAAVDDDWDRVAATAPGLLRDIAAQLIEHSAGEDTGIAVVSDLDRDAWTNQDVAYALAATWRRPGPVPARGLAQQLASDRFGHGAYALLEALLYVLGEQVEELWELVDRAFADRADEGPPWSDDARKELVLAVDALAWRPPPAWRRTGTWVTKFLAGVTPSDESWALVRFLRGYHPAGLLSYLAIQDPDLIAKVDRDRGTPWTADQTALGVWLVQWHFVHQCRARAQLAHQPWVDRVYLTTTFHACEFNGDRDRDSAELVASVAASRPHDVGWGFFLAENLRVVDPESFGPLTRTAALRSLEAARPDDQGVLAAVLTYLPDASYAATVRAHFDSDEAQDALFAGLARGLVVDDVRLVEPQFSHRRPLGAIFDTCGIRCDDIVGWLGQAVPRDRDGLFNVDEFIREFEAAATSLELDLLEQAALDAFMPQVRAGDLRPILSNARRPPGRRRLSKAQRYEFLVRSACAA
jgi:hypothetical protein